MAVGQLLRLNSAAAHPDIANQVKSLQGSIDELEDRASMSEVRADIANLDANLNHALSLLESARDKGYFYQADLEDIAYDAMSRWQAVRSEVDASIESQARQARAYISPVNQRVNQLNPLLSNASRAAGVMSQTEGEVRKALQSVADLERSIEAVYADIEQKANQLVSRLTRIHWALTQGMKPVLIFRLKKNCLWLSKRAGTRKARMTRKASFSLPTSGWSLSEKRRWPPKKSCLWQQPKNWFSRSWVLNRCRKLST